MLDVIEALFSSYRLCAGADSTQLAPSLLNTFVALLDAVATAYVRRTCGMVGSKSAKQLESASSFANVRTRALHARDMLLSSMNKHSERSTESVQQRCVMIDIEWPASLCEVMQPQRTATENTSHIATSPPAVVQQPALAAVSVSDVPSKRPCTEVKNDATSLPSPVATKAPAASQSKPHTVDALAPTVAEGVRETGADDAKEDASETKQKDVDEDNVQLATLKTPLSKPSDASDKVALATGSKPAPPPDEAKAQDAKSVATPEASGPIELFPDTGSPVPDLCLDSASSDEA